MDPENSEKPRPLGGRPLVDADFRKMVNAVTDYAIFLLDINGAIRSWNAGAKKLKQYDFHEVEGKHFSIFYPQELKDRQWPQHELKEALRLGRFEDEGWRVRRDGTRFWANIIITRLDDDDGTPVAFSKITRDLSERRQQEELLRHSEERFRLLVDNVRDYAIFMLDPGGYIVSWNAGAEVNTGYKSDEVVGKHFSIFYSEDIAQSDAPKIELETALHGGRFLDEGWRRRKDGSRYWAGVVLTPVFDRAGTHRGFAKVTRDLTAARKMLDMETEGRRVASYLAMLGHELRNPLAPVVNAVSVLKQLQIEAGPIVAVRDVIDRQVSQMVRLIDDLLDVSRITTGKIRLERKPVALRNVVSHALEATQPLIQQKQHHLNVEDVRDVWISGDSVRLVQILSNVLNNAAKFTPRGGTISLATHATGNKVEIRIKDNGPGIQPLQQENIFAMFTQGEQGLDRPSGGLGIGLALSRQLVTLHGGDIRVYSKGVSGQGSEFVIVLPVISKPLGSLQETSQNMQVLVVDDNADAADMLRMLVENLGYSTDVAYDGLQGVERAMKTCPQLVLMDIGMPGLSGHEAARRINQEMVNPPLLVAVSGYGQERDRQDSLESGFLAHLRKPVTLPQLAQLLKAHVREFPETPRSSV